MSTTLLQQILRYADWGWHVVPLHTPQEGGCSCKKGTRCDKPGKHPILPGWQKIATTDLDIIQGWWRDWPNANVGIATGNHLYALDVDGDQGRQTLARLEAQHGPLPETPRSLTGGGGEHYLFTLPEGVSLKNTVRFAPGLDTRGTGGQIVAAPSLHASGRRYIWDAGCHPADVEVAEMPAWLIMLIRQAPPPQAASTVPALRDHAMMIPQGMRDSTLFTEACALRGRGWGAEEIQAALDAINAKRCVPPLPAEQVKAKVEQAMRYAAGERGAGAAKAQDTPRRPITRISAADLLALDLPPLVYVVQEILPAGATLLTGKSKDGKSLMAYNLAVAVASGGKALGRYPVQQGAVWYLALEDGERRAQARLKAQMSDFEIAAATLRNLEMTLWEAPRIGEGLEEEMIEWIARAPNTRLIIIDILEKVRPLRKRNGNVYEEDYAATQSLTRLAQEKNVAVLIVHHANKLNPTDFRDSASGSMSLIGGADNFWSLNRQALSSDATLRITGRDILEEKELALQFKDGYWTVLDHPRQSPERQAIIDLLDKQVAPMKPADIAQKLQKHPTTIKRLLRMMLDAGVILQPFDGHYAKVP